MTKIRVSAHQFKTKEQAELEMKRIISYRVGRVKKIMKLLEIPKSELEEAGKELANAEKNDNKLIAFCKKQVKTKQLNLSRVEKVVKKKRGNYRHSNKDIFCNYVCIGKSTGEWVFSNVAPKKK